jgi:hypothetical protein
MSGHVVIVTGGRDCPISTRRVVNATLNSLYVAHGPFILFHGACKPRGCDEMVGADRYADDWAQTAFGTDLRRRPADWVRHGNEAGPIRNGAMVREAVREAPVERIHGLAFPMPRSRGTWNCVRRMEEFHIEVAVWDNRRVQGWLNGQGAR